MLRGYTHEKFDNEGTLEGCRQPWHQGRLAPCCPIWPHHPSGAAPQASPTCGNLPLPPSVPFAIDKTDSSVQWNSLLNSLTENHFKCSLHSLDISSLVKSVLEVNFVSMKLVGRGSLEHFTNIEELPIFYSKLFACS